MSAERLFLDTVYIQALLNSADKYHACALRLRPRVKEAREVWITEAVLLEVGAAFSTGQRTLATRFIRSLYVTPNVRIVPLDSRLFQQGINLYEQRPDKIWSLTDCISFIVMQEQSIRDAVTADEHFVQAGYRALLRESV